MIITTVALKEGNRTDLVELVEFWGADPNEIEHIQGNVYNIPTPPVLVEELYENGYFWHKWRDVVIEAEMP